MGHIREKTSASGVLHAFSLTASQQSIVLCICCKRERDSGREVCHDIATKYS